MMRNSLIIGSILVVYKKLKFYYTNSGTFKVLQRMGRSFGKLAAGSSILNFFDREWNIGSAWKKSFIFRFLVLPLRLFKFASSRLSDGTNSALGGSRALSAMKGFLEGLYNMSTRVYGLLFLTFAVTQGLLKLALNNGEMLLDMKGMIRLALLLAGTVMILINRPVRRLVEGSVTGAIAYDFFKVRGLKDGTDDNV
ncbi:MAG TPA: hypothetical protein VEG39_14170 [Clostridia bacterium]|nr:hypothetical protein [Clostridia bacterium]